MSQEKEQQYSADNIQSLEGMEHVRMRPSMYIGDVVILFLFLSMRIILSLLRITDVVFLWICTRKKEFLLWKL